MDLKGLTKSFLIVSSLILLSSCSSIKLSGRLERMIPGNSVHKILGTPRPDQWKESEGQELIVSWNLLYSKVNSDPLKLHVDIVFTKGQREVIAVDSVHRWGHWTYEHDLEKIKKQGSIATYKIWITQGSRTVEEFRHKLYREWLDADALEEESSL